MQAADALAAGRRLAAPLLVDQVADDAHELAHLAHECAVGGVGAGRRSGRLEVDGRGDRHLPGRLSGLEDHRVGPERPLHLLQRLRHRRRREPFNFHRASPPRAT